MKRKNKIAQQVHERQAWLPETESQLTATPALAPSLSTNNEKYENKLARLEDIVELGNELNESALLLH